MRARVRIGTLAPSDWEVSDVLRHRVPLALVVSDGEAKLVWLG